MSVVESASTKQSLDFSSLDPSYKWLGLSRPELFTFAFAIVTASAIMPITIQGAYHDGLVFSLLNTFEISAIVWGAIAVGAHYALCAESKPIDRYDRAIVVVSLLPALLPFGPLSWVLLSALALTVILRESEQDPLRRAGWIFFAISVPMFWSKRLFNIFANFFLSIDAAFVSSITQTERISNLVAIPNGHGYLEIAPRCSSMANVSLALLCWILFTQTSGLRWRPRNILWCAAACGSVVLINVTRISLIGFFPAKYDLIHGAVGSTVTSWVTVLTIFGICYLGVGRGRFNTF